jgi:Cu/Ag efflux pump CusA
MGVASFDGFITNDPSLSGCHAHAIPLSTVIEKVRSSTNEVGGRVLEMGGAEDMIRGSGICVR